MNSNEVLSKKEQCTDSRKGSMQFWYDSKSKNMILIFNIFKLYRVFMIHKFDKVLLKKGPGTASTNGSKKFEYNTG